MRFFGFILLAAQAVTIAVAAESPRVSERFVLSEQGSGRATAYSEATKIITFGDKTHVAWLDSDRSGFHVRARTLDRQTGIWSQTVTIGRAQDNHGGPALTVDSKGFLHVVYYPHHRAFRYRQSVRPNDVSEWTEEQQFGESLSYPVMLCAPDNTLILTARRYYEANDRLNEVELWTKPVGKAWQRDGVILKARYLNYTQFAESLAWGPDGAIHLSARIYETNPKKDAAPVQTLGYMRSKDRGRTWTKSDGSPISAPATADSIEVLVRGGDDTGLTLVPGSLAVDRLGTPHLLHSIRDAKGAKTFLLTPSKTGTWTRREMNRYLPENWREHDLAMIGAVTFSESGRCTIIGCAVKLAAGEMDWGHRSSEIVRLWSDDGARTFQAEILEPTDSNTPHWLPNLERFGGHNRVPDEPGIIFTAGSAGGGLHDLELNNRVIWQPRSVNK